MRKANEPGEHLVLVANAEKLILYCLPPYIIIFARVSALMNDTEPSETIYKHMLISRTVFGSV